MLAIASSPTTNAILLRSRRSIILRMISHRCIEPLPSTAPTPLYVTRQEAADTADRRDKERYLKIAEYWLKMVRTMNGESEKVAPNVHVGPSRVPGEVFHLRDTKRARQIKWADAGDQARNQRSRARG